ncbi:MAG: deoxyribonuclease IV [Coriobacteriia bacterium]|nr:deoxyribonuclease IV [Coriobacteriia bacterium]
MIFGAHVGIAGGYPAAVDYAVSVGCECMQVFAKSPRQWSAKSLDVAVAEAFRSRIAEVGMGPVFVHTAYLINLGSDDDALWERSWQALADEIARGELLGAVGIVTHVGTRYKSVPEKTAARIARGVDLAWAASGAGQTRLLLENTAAAGTTYGNGPDELGSILHALDVAAGHVGVCLDTCHAHAAGWDLADPGGWDRLLGAFDSCCGMPIEVIHANDSAFGVGEHKDRHAWIGDGTIGLDGFRRMVEEPRLATVPVITEMPGETPGKDLENLRRLKSLRDACVGCGTDAALRA